MPVAGRYRAQVADGGACAIEHHLSDQIMDRMVRFFEYMRSCPSADSGFIERHVLGFDRFAARVAEFPPSRAAEIAEVPVASIEALVAALGRTRPAAICAGRSWRCRPRRGERSRCPGHRRAHQAGGPAGAEPPGHLRADRALPRRAGAGASGAGLGPQRTARHEQACRQEQETQRRKASSKATLLSDATASHDQPEIPRDLIAFSEAR